MRITAGRLRGRHISFAKMTGVRPTPSKVRQAVFNILGNIDSWRVLDLFSGSGLIALEAISRGADEVISIERQRPVCRQLQSIRIDWELQRHWRILCGDVRAMLARLSGQRFDLVFADPPYEKGISSRIPEWLNREKILCHRLLIEESARTSVNWPGGWTVHAPRRYGDTCVYTLEAEDC